MPFSSDLRDEASHNQNLFKLLFEAHPQPTWVFEKPSLKVIACNRLARERYGYSEENFLRLSVADLISAQQLAQFLEFAERSIHSRDDFLLVSHLTRDGKSFLAGVHFTSIQYETVRFHLVIITEPAWPTMNLSQIKMLVDNLPFLVDAFDDNKRVILWNKECERVTGYSSEEIQNMADPFAVLYPDPKQRQQMFQEFEQRGRLFYQWELPLQAKDGTTKIISWTNISDQVQLLGNCNWAIGIDVTHDRQVSHELAQKNSILAGITNNIPGIAIFQYILEGKEGYYTYISENIQEISGVSAAELLSGQSRLRDLLTEKDHNRLLHLFAESSQRQGQVDFEAEAIDKFGRKRIWLFRAQVHRQTPNQVVYNGIILDITEKRQIQLQIERAQKYQIIGILAGGIAHDFNNLLTSIMGNAQLGQMQIEPHSELNEYFTGIIQSSEKAASLCQKILIYAGRKMGRKTWIDLNQAILELNASLGSIVAKKIRLELDLQPNLPPIFADSTLIDQLLVNLLTNASESYQGREGIIQLKTLLVEQQEEDFRKMLVQESCSSGRYILLEITDQGCGIEEDKIHLIFEPYYTTKEVGRGLGLAAVQGIVRNLYGAINVHSQVNQGTIFKIYLPIQAINSNLNP